MVQFKSLLIIPIQNPGIMQTLPPDSFVETGLIKSYKLSPKQLQRNVSCSGDTIAGLPKVIAGNVNAIRLVDAIFSPLGLQIK